MNNGIKFVIVTITYKNPEELRLTASSISRLDQNLLSWIVVDGGSPYFDVAFANSVSNVAPLHSWVSKKDSGIYDAMNNGLDLISRDTRFDPASTYVCFINSGDAAHPELNLSHLSRFIADTESQVLYAGVSERFNGKRAWLWHPRTSARSIKWGMPFEHQAAFVRADVLFRLRFDTRYRFSGDYDLLSRVLSELNYTGYRIYPHKVCRFMMGGASFSNRFEAIYEGALIRLRVHKMSFIGTYFLAAYFGLLHVAKSVLFKVIR